jgi:hypothetical protein
LHLDTIPHRSFLTSLPQVPELNRYAVARGLQETTAMKSELILDVAFAHLDEVCNLWEDEVLAPLNLLTYNRSALPPAHEYWCKRQKTIAFYAPRLVEAVKDTKTPAEEKADWIFSVYQDLLNTYGGRKEKSFELDSSYYPMRREFITNVMGQIL